MVISLVCSIRSHMIPRLSRDNLSTNRITPLVKSVVRQTRFWNAIAMAERESIVSFSSANIKFIHIKKETAFFERTKL